VTRISDPRLDAAFTRSVRRRVPRWGSVAQPGTEGAALSTAPGGSLRPPDTPGPAVRGPAAPRRPSPRPASPSELTVPRSTASRSTAPRSTASRPTASRSTAPRSTASWTAGAVVIGGLAFLVGRLAIGGLPSAVPLLAVGYLALAGVALAVGEEGAGRTDRAAGRGPLGWWVPLVLGLVGVVGAAIVGGPVADRRVGGVAVGLALLAAVAEEALFRRLLYDRLLRFGVLTAVMGSAVVFAVVHLPAYGVAAMPVDLGAALLLSWQRYASGRWTVPAVTHVVANLLAVT
jgi:membrane protease YdiL (CAAX protease family)